MPNRKISGPSASRSGPSLPDASSGRRRRRRHARHYPVGPRGQTARRGGLPRRGVGLEQSSVPKRTRVRSTSPSSTRPSPTRTALLFCRQFRRHPAGRHAVVIAVTADDRLERLSAALESGINDYILKPVDPRILAIRIVIAEQRSLANATSRYSREALRESESRFEAFMANSPTAAFIKDAEGRFLYVNRRYLEPVQDRGSQTGSAAATSTCSRRRSPGSSKSPTRRCSNAACRSKPSSACRCLTAFTTGSPINSRCTTTSATRRSSPAWPSTSPIAFEPSEAEARGVRGAAAAEDASRDAAARRRASELADRSPGGAGRGLRRSPIDARGRAPRRSRCSIPRPARCGWRPPQACRTTRQALLANVPAEVWTRIRDEFRPVLSIPEFRDRVIPADRELVERAGIRTCLAAMVRHEDRLLGTITAWTLDEVREFTADERALLQGVADQAALAISNAQALADLRQGEEQMRNAQKLESLGRARRRHRPRLQQPAGRRARQCEPGPDASCPRSRPRGSSCRTSRPARSGPPS